MQMHDPINNDFATSLQRIIELNIKDPRHVMLITYPLHVICTIVTMARLAGANNVREQCLYWKLHLKELQEIFYGLGDEVPSEQTIRRVIGLCKVDESLQFLTKVFALYHKDSPFTDATQSNTLLDRDVIAADGQNIRATRSSKIDNDLRKDGGYDIVSLFSSKYGVTLTQRLVDKKNNEAPAIIEMIGELNLQNCILTWDAINTRVNTLNAVIDAGADFVVSVKSNQGSLYEEITDAFDNHVDKDKYKGDILTSGATVTSAHGRIEEKDIVILNAEDSLSKQMCKKWQHIRSVIRVSTIRTYKSSGEISDVEYRYFVSSIAPDGLDESFAKTMLEIILSRWTIESRHWVIDVVFGQDRLPLRNRKYIENSTIYTKIAINVLSYVRDNIPKYNGKPWSFESLRTVASNPEFNFKFLHAFFKKDMSVIKDDGDLFILFYEKYLNKNYEEHLEVNGFEVATIPNDCPLGEYARKHSKIKSKSS